jgi:glyoxylase-like metal-dependent hydrolase (beta-lactamase superfamily II)
MIKIENFTFNPIQVNTYVLYAENKDCIIVDPGCYYESEYNKLYSFIEDNELKPIAMVATHYHFDHLMGSAQLAKRYKIPLMGHADYKLLFVHMDVKKQANMFEFDFEMPPDTERELKHEDEIILGNNVIKIIHVPGHSPCGIALYLKEEKTLLTGDILFEGSIGRCDLYLGDMDLLVSGIKKKLLTLPDDTRVFTGHGYDTTIGNEKTSNPFL